MVSEVVQLDGVLALAARDLVRVGLKSSLCSGCFVLQRSVASALDRAYCPCRYFDLGLTNAPSNLSVDEIQVASGYENNPISMPPAKSVTVSTTGEPTP